MQVNYLSSNYYHPGKQKHRQGTGHGVVTRSGEQSSDLISRDQSAVISTGRPEVRRSVPGEVDGGRESVAGERSWM